VCSQECSSALERTEQALDSIQAKSVSSIRWSGYFLLTCSLLFLAFAIFFWLIEGIWQLAVFCLPIGLVFAVIAFVIIRIAKRKETDRSLS